MHRLIVTSADLSPVVAARPGGDGDATRATASSGGRPRRGWRPRWSATRCSPSRAGSTRRLGGPSFRDHDDRQGRRDGRRSSTSRPTPRPPASTAGPSTGPGPAAAGAPCSTPSTAPTPRPPPPGGAVTTTPLQALALMNNALVLHLADAFAARLAREAGPDPGRQVDLAYRLAFGRAPEPDERARAVAGGRAVRARRRWRGRSSTATSSSTSIDRPSPGGAPWTVASSSPGPGTAWPARRRPR